jgi:Mn-dependent DtxR family transcriptional regulator
MAIEVALPYRTDWREMSSVLDYCKGKGADRSALEARFGAGESLRETLNALEQLGLIERSDAGDVRLTVLGERLAYAPDRVQLRARLVEALLSYAPYRFPLERAVADAAELLDAPWVEHIWQVDMRLGQPRNRVEEARTFFFRLADEAGLGTYRRGVRGQTTRLELSSSFASTLRPLLQRESAELAVPVDSMSVSPDRGRERATNAAPETAQMTGPGPAMAGGPLQRVELPELPASVTGTPGPLSLSIQVDMSNWELDKIEAFLRMVGYLPRPD